MAQAAPRICAGATANGTLPADVWRHTFVSDRCCAFGRQHAWQSRAQTPGSRAAPELRRQIKLRALQQAHARAPEGLTTLPWQNTPEQQQALQEVSMRMAGCPSGIPDEETMQWFLRDRKFNVAETVSKLEKMMKWRQEFDAHAITKGSVAEEAASGKAYLHSDTDVNGRPVIVIRVQKHVTGEYPLDSSKRLCVQLLEEALAGLPEDGETLLGVFDLSGFSHRNTDFGFVRFLVDIFFTYYPKRLGQVLFVDAPWIFQPGWEVVKPWLKKYSALVRFVKREQLLDEYFTPETEPADFKR